MKVTFLGTGTSQGIPVIGCHCEVCRSLNFQDKRLRTSLYLEVDGTHIVIDTGPDFREQALANRIPRLDAVVFTHPHRDHIAGLDDVRSYNFMQEEDIHIYANTMTMEKLKSDYDYAFREKKYPGVPQLSPQIITTTPFSVNNVPLLPIEVMHGKMPVLGFQINNFTYITDANQIPEEALNQVKGTEYLVLNALQHQPHYSHFTLEEAIEMSKTIGARHTFFTHISHNLGLHQEVGKQLPENISLAYDGLTLTC